VVNSLLVDVGTSSVRAAVASADGAWLGVAARVHRPTVDQDGASIFDPDRLVRRTRAVIRRAVEAAGVPIDVVATACLAPSLMGIDSNGRPTTPLFLYADLRAAPDAAQLRRRLDPAAVHARTGAPIHASYWPAKLAWLGRVAPGVGSSSRWLDFGAFLYQRLVGRAATSASLISWTGLHDVLTGEWDPELLSSVSVTTAAMPTVEAHLDPVVDRAEGSAARSLSPLMAGATWLPPVADGYASTIGLIGPGSSRVAANLGTTFAVRALLSSRPTTVPSSLFRHGVGGGSYVVGGALAEGGGTFEWLGRTFGRAVTRNVLARPTSRRGTPGPVVVPTLDGERSPGWDECSRGSISGISSTTTREAIVEAWIEAIAVRLATVERDLEVVAGAPEAIVVAGKASRSPFLVAEFERLTQRPVIVGDEEATLRGLLHLVQAQPQLVNRAAAPRRPGDGAAPGPR
jgi:gluconokinase